MAYRRIEKKGKELDPWFILRADHYRREATRRRYGGRLMDSSMRKPLPVRVILTPKNGKELQCSK